jgi:hypothetical protein
MASGRPRQPNDPSIMASLGAAMSMAARPGLIARAWHWRYESGLVAGVVLGMVSIGVTLGPGWRGEADGAESEEPALYYGLGLPRPLG